MKKKMHTPEQKKELVSYLHTRLKYIKDCASLIEGFFDDEERKVDNSVPANNKLSSKQKKAYRNILGYTITFRYCFLVAVCSLVEESLKEVSKLIIPNYSQKLKGFKGSKIKKYFQLLESEGINFEPIQEQIDLFDDIIIVRNAIVHSWGNIDKARNPAELRAVIEKYTKKDRANSWIEETEKGEIILNEVTAVIPALIIVRHILKNTHFI